MGYALSDGRHGLAGSTQCVLVDSALAAQLSKYGYGTTSGGGAFTFYDGVTPRSTMTLQLATLDDAVAGAQVLIDNGGGRWSVKTVTADGTTATANGTPVEAAARAAVLVSRGAKSGDKLTLLGTAVNGQVWFQGPTGVLFASSMSTVGALQGAGLCAVEASGWVVASL